MTHFISLINYHGMNNNLWLIKTNKLPVIIFLSGCIKKTKCIWFTANHNGYGIIIKNWKNIWNWKKITWKHPNSSWRFQHFWSKWTNTFLSIEQIRWRAIWRCLEELMFHIRIPEIFAFPDSPPLYWSFYAILKFLRRFGLFPTKKVSI